MKAKHLTDRPPRAVIELLAGRQLPSEIGADAVEYALTHEISSLLVAEAKHQGVSLRSSKLHELHATHMGRANQQQKCAAVLEELAQLAETLGVPLSAFKGLALARTVYADSASRPSNDVDVQVGPCDRQALIELLRALGRGQTSAEAIANLADEGRPIHEVWGTLQGFDIDIHFNPYGLITPLHSPESSWHASSASTFDLCGTEIDCPSPEQHLLICLVNLVRRGGGALRFYADAARIIAAGVDWPTFEVLSKSERLTYIASQALLALERDLQLDIPSKASAAAWWGPRIGEPPARNNPRRRGPFLTLRLDELRADDLRTLAGWYLPDIYLRNAGR